MAQNIPESVVDAVCDGDLVAVSAWLKNGGNEFVDEALEGHPFILPSLKHLISQAIEHSANASAIVELLLQAGAHPRLEFLLAAIEKENVEAALLLVAHGADVRGSQDGLRNSSVLTARAPISRRLASDTSIFEGDVY